MKTGVALLLAAGAFGFLAGCSSDKHLAAYMPIEKTQNRNRIVLRERPDWLNEQHIVRIEQVFDAYKVPYKMKKGQLLIPDYLQADHMTLSNYTARANDPNWPQNEQKKPSQSGKLPGWSVQGGVSQ